MTKFIALACVISVLIAVFVYEKNRADNLEQMVRQMGFHFKRGLQSLPEEIKNTGFHLFNQPHQQIQHLISGSIDNYQVKIFDFHFDAPFGYEADPILASGSDDDEYTNYQQTVIYIKAVNIQTAEFDLSPAAGVLRSAAKLRHLKSVHFDQQQAFDKQYELLAKDATAIQHIFNPKILQWLIEHPNITIESFGDRWLIYQLGERIKAKNLSQVLNTALGFIKQISTTDQSN